MLTDAEFNEAYEKYSRAIYFSVRRIVNNDAAAEEILQDTFLRFLEKAEPGRSSEHKSFLYNISHNLAVDYIRRNSRIKLTENILLTPDRRNFSEESDARILRDTIIRGLAKTDEKYLRIFLLRVDYEMTYDEISETLKIPKRTLVRYVENLKKLLREFL